MIIRYVAHRVGPLQWVVFRAAFTAKGTVERFGGPVAGPFMTRGIAMRTADDIEREAREAYDQRASDDYFRDMMTRSGNGR